jgi:hypothetical protein
VSTWAAHSLRSWVPTALPRGPGPPSGLGAPPRRAAGAGEARGGTQGGELVPVATVRAERAQLAPGSPRGSAPLVDGSFTSPVGRRAPCPPRRWRRGRRWRTAQLSLAYRIGEAIEDDAMLLALAHFQQYLGHIDAAPVLPMLDGLMIEVPEQPDVVAAASTALRELMGESLRAVCPRVVSKVKVEGPMDCWKCAQVPSRDSSPATTDPMSPSTDPTAPRSGSRAPRRGPRPAPA